MAGNAEFARSFLEAWNKRDFDYMSQSTARDATITILGSGRTYRGPEGTREYNAQWAEAFPDGKITVDRVVEAGDVVVVEYTGRGKHTGPLEAPGGTFPATGRSVTLHMCDIYEIRAGKVRSQHTYLDSGALMAQLGMTVGQATTL